MSVLFMRVCESIHIVCVDKEKETEEKEKEECSEGIRQGVREGKREAGREEGREKGRQGGREGGGKGGREKRGLWTGFVGQGYGIASKTYSDNQHYY